MKLYLTSNPCLEERTALNPANGLIESLRGEMKQPAKALFVASDPSDHRRTDGYSKVMFYCFVQEGFTFASWTVLDDENAADAPALVRGADFIILAGGHVPTQNRFFHRIGLKDLLAGYDGVVMGVSAGSMNSAETVYAHPELPGEAVDPAYRRFLPGLGLTKRMILPHYYGIKDDVLDGLRVFEDIAYPDSMGREFVILPDGSYIHAQGGAEELRGEGWLLRDGKMEKVCGEGERVALK